MKVVVTITAQETGGDWTTAKRSETYMLYPRPSGCSFVIGSASLGAFDSNGYLARSFLANPYSLGPGDTDTVNKSFVQRYTVWDDRPGRDVGKNVYTSVQVTTRPFTIRLSG